MGTTVLDIIVIDLYSNGGFPLKRQVKISLSNRSALSGVILLSFQYYCGVVLVILLFIFHFYHFISIMHTFISRILQVVSEHFPWQKILGNFFPG